MFHGGTAIPDRRHDVIVKKKIAPSAKPCTKTKRGDEAKRRVKPGARRLAGV